MSTIVVDIIYIYINGRIWKYKEICIPWIISEAVPGYVSRPIYYPPVFKDDLA